MLKRENIKVMLNNLAEKRVNKEKESLLKKEPSGGMKKLSSQGHGDSEADGDTAPVAEDAENETQPS